MKKLSYLLSGIARFIENDIAIENVCIDSRKVKKGDLFVCIKGSLNDGHDFVETAEKNGAVCIVSEKPIKTLQALNIVVADTKTAYSKICCNFWSNPANFMKIITIIGTNGKTTTAFLTDAILREAGKKVGVIGTLGMFYNGEKIEDAGLTTPDSFDINRMLFSLKERGADVAIIEVSAHAIDQGRINGIRANVSVFTNFSQDHLDYFKTMETYESVKMSYFHSCNTEFAVINVDDKTGCKIIRNIDIPYISYALHNPSDVFAIDIEDCDGLKYIANILDDIVSISTKMHGAFNVYNMLAAISVAKILGVTDSSIKQALAEFNGVKGRFLMIENHGRKIIIDFAHTPDGLENILSEVKSISSGKLHVLFGCGGERDKGKRSLMGKIAEKYADHIYLTSDNSRSERSIDIINEINSGIINKQIVTIVPSRENAIKQAITEMKNKECLVIAGKGGEETMEENGCKIPFSDEKIVLECVEEEI